MNDKNEAEKIDTASGPPPEMGWPAALEATFALLWVRRKSWPQGHAVTWQIPDAHSKMTEPYLYMRFPHPHAPGGVACVPWGATNVDMWARDWEIG